MDRVRFRIEPCPCGSEDISINGMAWIQVNCNTCQKHGLPFSYGSRLERYCEAIEAWNNREFKEYPHLSCKDA
jgi:hypothetical protein